MTGKYKPGDQIARHEAWQDFLDNFTREEWGSRPFHVYKAIWVDVARIIGVADRDTSQYVGMVLAIAFPIAVAVTIWSLI